MKKFVLLIFVISLSVFANAQLSGSFQNMQDGHIYFVLTNPTSYNLYVSWWATNSIRNEQLNNSYVLEAGCSSYFGPSTIGWTWIRGERFTVVVNGKSGYWECPETDMALKNGRDPSFGSNWISVSVNVAKCSGRFGSVCSCKVYKGYKRAGLNQYKGNCTNYAGGHQCGHGPSAHGLTEY